MQARLHLACQDAYVCMRLPAAGEGDWRHSLHSSECPMERCWRLWRMVGEWRICLAHLHEMRLLNMNMACSSWPGCMGRCRCRLGRDVAKSPEGWPINALAGRLYNVQPARLQACIR